jgi:hypothetical protein
MRSDSEAGISEVEAIFLRKALAIAGICLTGTTLVSAYSLQNYPSQFIKDGNFDGHIIIGEKAATQDVLGSIDIAASLQAGSVTKTLPTYHGVVLSGDTKAFNGGKLQIRKKPATMLTANDIKAFAKGRITNSQGTTEYDQFLRVGTTGLQQMTANYVQNDQSKLSDYLVIAPDAPFFEWELRFSDGFKSRRDTDGKLSDFNDETIGLVGMNATIVSAEIGPTGTDFTMTLMGGSAGDTLREGETKTYTVDDHDYEVTLVFVSDPSSGTPEVTFSVNGEMTHSLEKGDTDVIGGIQLGVRDILVNAREGAAGFYLGARKITITDPTPSTEDFDGRVSVNGENIPEGQFQIMGNFDAANSSFRIGWMKYRYSADALQGSTVYMKENQLLRPYLRRPQGMLSDIDFHYHGILPAETKNLTILKSTEDSYRMTFYNNDGKRYEFPLLSNRNGVWKFGDENDDLIFVEGQNGSDHNIGIHDYFIVSNNRGSADADKPITYVLRYVDYDPAQLVVMFEMDKKIIKVPLSSNGVGYLIPGAQTYKINVSSTTGSQPNLSIDLDADGTYSDSVKVITYGGVIINLAQNVYLSSDVNTTLTGVNISTAVGNGKRISDAAGFTAGAGFVQIGAQILAKKFDTPGIDETFNWTIRQSSDRIDLTMGIGEYRGPLSTDTSNINTGFIFTADSANSQHTTGITDYGIFIDKYTPADHPSELKLSIPQTQRYTQLFVSTGEVIHGKPAPAEKVNPIAVGIALLDKNAPAIGSTNMIVIGGPCVNTVAATLLGSPQDCSEGFEPGKAVIRAWEKEGKVAILVAGYDADDTLGASRVLATYKSYHLEGEEVTFSVDDLSSIQVRPGR